MTDRLRLLKDGLWFLVFAGAVAILFRLWYGLGATTNLSDSVPWGLWKILNMVAGVALSTGGFTVGLLVYVLGVERLRPLVRPAILIAFLGYGSSVFALMLDIGLPHRIWHPIVMWNPHSFLFEVAMCVMTYFAITTVELAPAIFGRHPRLRVVGDALHRLAAPIVIAGITLSSLHHTSLGSLFLVTPQRLHPLWYTGWLPVLFITSAMGAGMMVTVLAGLAWNRLREPTSTPDPPARACSPRPVERPAPPPELKSLAAIATGILLCYFLLKLADLARTGALRAILDPTWETWLCCAELVLIAVVPGVALALPRLRNSFAGLAVAAASATGGLILNRLNVGIFGYLRDAGEVYLPSLAEWALCLGVIAASVLVFLFLAENFPIFEERRPRSARPAFVPRFDKLSTVWVNALGGPLNRVTLVAVAAVPLAWVLLTPAAGRPARVDPVRAPVALDVQRAVLRLDGNQHAYAVEFPHLDHRRRLGGDASCSTCHHLALPADHTTPCTRCHRAMHSATVLFDHAKHFDLVAKKEGLRGWQPGNRSCGTCHPPGSAREGDTAKPCLECHRNDMRPSPSREHPCRLNPPAAYRVAFHGMCGECHAREAKRLQRPALGECTNCHPRGDTPPRGVSTMVAASPARGPGKG